ncbi:hypothetical protein BDZ89DRAFT_225236 [Hymenopellis radicata]|nr:hypothetical protein BDZ89DRAFT_225236 [Hymenopellis radicata]
MDATHDTSWRSWCVSRWNGPSFSRVSDERLRICAGHGRQRGSSYLLRPRKRRIVGVFYHASTFEHRGSPVPLMQVVQRASSWWVLDGLSNYELGVSASGTRSLIDATSCDFEVFSLRLDTNWAVKVTRASLIEAASVYSRIRTASKYGITASLKPIPQHPPVPRYVG